MVRIFLNHEFIRDFYTFIILVILNRKSWLRGIILCHGWFWNHISWNLKWAYQKVFWKTEWQMEELRALKTNYQAFKGDYNEKCLYINSSPATALPPKTPAVLQYKCEGTHWKCRKMTGCNDFSPLPSRQEIGDSRLEWLSENYKAK